MRPIRRNSPAQRLVAAAQLDALGQVALGHRLDHPGHLGDRAGPGRRPGRWRRSYGLGPGALGAPAPSSRSVSRPSRPAVRRTRRSSAASRRVALGDLVVGAGELEQRRPSPVSGSRRRNLPSRMSSSADEHAGATAASSTCMTSAVPRTERRCLDLDHERDDHRPPAVGVADPLADGAADELLELAAVADAVGGGPLQRLLDQAADVVEDAVVLGEAAGVDLGAAARPCRSTESTTTTTEMNPSSREDAPVLERRLGDVADGGAVDVHVAARHRARRSRARPSTRSTTTPSSASTRAVARHAGQHREVGVGAQVPPLAVHRHHVARPDDVVDVEQLAGRGVAGDVHHRVALVHDRGAPAGSAR